jgi:hypothetical protein
MITVLRAHGLRVVIYKDDHPPAHVHVLGDGEMRILLEGPDGRPDVLDVYRMKARDISRALAVVHEEQPMLLALWRSIHG